MYTHLHAAGVAIANLNIAINHHGFANKSHRAHADIISQFFEFIFKRGNFRIGVVITNHAKTGSAFSKNHTAIFRTTKTNANNRWLAGKAALAKSDKRVKIKPFDAFNPVTWEQHPVISTKKATFVNRDKVNPIAIRFKTIFDFGCPNANIIIMVGSP